MSSAGRFLRIAVATAQSLAGRVAYRLGWHGCARRRFEQVLLLRGADFTAYVHLGRIAFDSGDYASWRREFEHARRTDPIRFARLRHANELIEPRLAGTPFDTVSELDGYQATDTRATWRALHPFGADARATGGPGRDDFDRGADLPLAPGFDPAFPNDAFPGEALPGDHNAGSHGGPFGERDRSDDDVSGGIEGDGIGGDGIRGEGVPGHSMPDAAMNRDDFASAAERRRFQLRRPIDRRDIERCDFNELARRLSS